MVGHLYHLGMVVLWLCSDDLIVVVKSICLKCSEVPELSLSLSFSLSQLSIEPLGLNILVMGRVCVCVCVCFYKQGHAWIFNFGVYKIFT